MGYNTSYTLEIRDLPSITDEEIIADLRKRYEYADYCLMEDGAACQSGKWYDHEADMIAFSRQYPNKLFVLYGEGEEAGDVWKKYFVNGKVQVAKSEIRIDEFDPLKLT